VSPALGTLGPVDHPDHPGHPDYRRWIITHGHRPGARTITPTPALADVELYDGTRAQLEGHVVAVAPGWVCVRQDVGAGREWLAWVAAGDVQRR